MNITNLRCSSIIQWKDCQFRYWLHNLCGIESVAGKKANLGTCVHAVLELLAKRKKYKQHLKSSKFNDPMYLLNIAWNQMVKNTPDDYTKQDYDFCVDQINNVLNSQFHPFKLNIIDVEKQFELRITRPGFDNLLFRGTVDLVTEPESSVIELCDYKTGKRLDWITGEEKDYHKLEKDIQLRGYNLAVRHIYLPPPEVVLFTINFTQDGGPYTIPFGDEAAEETLEEIRLVYNEILNTYEPKRLIDNRKRNKEFFKCKYVCQFGTHGEIEYTNGEEVIVVESKISKPKEIPNTIEKNDKIYFLLGVKQSLCQKYHRIMKKYTPDIAIPIIQNLTLNGSPISKRNDYSATTIHKGIIA